jgi:hypothetical protein
MDRSGLMECAARRWDVRGFCLEDKERDFLMVATEDEVEFERWLLLFWVAGVMMALRMGGQQQGFVTPSQQGYCWMSSERMDSGIGM